MAGNANSGGGSKKEKHWRDALRRAVARQGENMAAGFDKIADVVVAQALDGDKDAWQEIGNRIDGKPKQQVEHSGEDGGDIPVRVITGVPRESD